MMIFNFPPGLLYVLGGILSLILPKKLRWLPPLVIPLVAMLQLLNLDTTAQFTVHFLTYTVNLLRVDSLSLTFGYVFVIASMAGFLYGIGTAKKTEYGSAMIYIGSALSVVFAKDFISLYIFWELMAISSMCLILLKKTDKSRKSALRYIIVHLVGGLILMAGIMLHVHSNFGDISFNPMTLSGIATNLILIGFLINAAAVPFSSWLSDAYPESTLMGGVILSAYTTKTAVYALLRGFPGTDVLIWMGVTMALFGVIYAVYENDIRRILAFSLINQGGFMICGIGIGSPLALAGSAAHAFSCILYSALLWMAAGAVIKQTGTSKCTELGGLYRHMPMTLMFAIVGAMAIAAAPFASGFTTKMLILKAAKMDHLFWPWIGLELASVGVVFHAGVKFIYNVFFGKHRGHTPKEAPFPMLAAMGSCALITLMIGCFPDQLYRILPYSETIMNTVPSTFYGIYIKYLKDVVTQLELLLSAVFVFLIIKPALQPNSKITLDFDWLYRRLLRYITVFVIGFIDFIYNFINKASLQGIKKTSSFFKQSVPLVLFLVNVPIIRMSQIKINSSKLINTYAHQVTLQAFPFVVLGSLAFIVFIVLFILIN